MASSAAVKQRPKVQHEPEAFGARLAHLRAKKQLSQAQLATAAGISKRMVAAYETENVNPPASILPRLAAALDVTIDALFRSSSAEAMQRPVVATTAPKAASKPARRGRRPSSAPDGLGQRLGKLRRARGLTQRAFADVVGTSHQMVVYYESGRGNPPASLLPKFAKALKVTTDELLGLVGRGRAEPTNVRLWRKLRQLERLPAQQQKAVLRLIDSVLAAQRDAV
jgi:transcriptional regulator with XRE-family HTH domain